MKSVLKIATASALVANSAFAMNFFAGGSIGATVNNLDFQKGNTNNRYVVTEGTATQGIATDSTITEKGFAILNTALNNAMAGGTELPTNSAFGNIKGYETNYTNTSFKQSLSSLNFGLEGGAVFNLADSFDMTAEAFVGFNMLKTKVEDTGFEAKSGFSFGVQTKAMYAISDTTKLYGLLGMGMMKFSYKANILDKSKNSLFAKFGLGAEFMVMDNFGMYTEFAYVMPFSKLKSDTATTRPLQDLIGTTIATSAGTFSNALSGVVSDGDPGADNIFNDVDNAGMVEDGTAGGVSAVTITKIKQAETVSGEELKMSGYQVKVGFRYFF
jgi:hypothetical protein